MGRSAKREVYAPASQEDDPALPAARLPMPIYVYEQVLNVTIVDELRQPHSGICRCAACQRASLEDRASDFI